jgi:hypothetical protein
MTRRLEVPGFELHDENMRSIGASDIVIPSLGGAGSSLLATLLLDLGLDYVDLAKDRIMPNGSTLPQGDMISRRLRPDTGVARPDGGTPGPRFLKTHLPAEEFAGRAIGGVWLLIRDPRDAIYSWYRYHRDFGEREWERVEGSFEDFLRRPFFTGHPPADGWGTFYAGWAERASGCEHAAVLRFEDLKRAPAETMRSALEALGLSFEPHVLERAIDRSSYEAMRAREDQVAVNDRGHPEARVMRSGEVDAWRAWMTPRLARYFSGEPTRSVARRFGYDLAG